MSRTKNFRYTHNNYEGTALEDQIECQYMIYGKEIAPTTGTPHLQGFVRFLTEKSLKQVRSYLPGCDVRVADMPEAAIEYCKKDGEYTERGTAPIFAKQKGAGEKRRWGEIREACEQGRFEDLPDEIRYKNLKLNKAHRNEALRSRELHDTEAQMLWYYGEAGTGKSRKAREENPGAYLKMCNKWWDGYTDQDVVIIEDFDEAHSVLCHHLKIWGDRYPFLAEVKGDAINIRPKLIIVTSNYHPRDIWVKDRDVEPILRRFKCEKFAQLEK